MTNTLIVTFTPREGSKTQELLDLFLSKIETKTNITICDLDTTKPPLKDSDVMKTWWSPEADNQYEAVSKTFITQLQEADNIVVVTPMYNWGLPAPVKAWLDAVIRSGKTFSFGESGAVGLLKAKNSAVIMTTGMTAISSDSDLLSKNLKLAFGLMGVENFEIVGAENLLIVPKDQAEAEMLKAKSQVETLATNWF